MHAHLRLGRARHRLFNVGSQRVVLLEMIHHALVRVKVGGWVWVGAGAGARAGAGAGAGAVELGLGQAITLPILSPTRTPAS